MSSPSSSPPPTSSAEKKRNDDSENADSNKKAKIEDKSSCSCHPIAFSTFDASIDQTNPVTCDLSTESIQLFLETGMLPCKLCMDKMWLSHYCCIGHKKYNWADIVFRHWSLSDGQRIMGKLWIVAASGQGLVFQGEQVDHLHDLYQKRMPTNDWTWENMAVMISHAYRAALLVSKFTLDVAQPHTEKDIIDLGVYGELPAILPGGS